MTAALLALALPPSSARADAGEFVFGMPIAFEVAATTHPETTATLFSDGSTTILKPRTGVDFRYGLTNDLSIGVGGHLAASTSIRTPKVTIDNSSGDLLTAQYLELSAPLAVVWRFDSGLNLSGVAELELGPIATYWGVQDLVDFADVDENGLPADLERNAPDVWLLGGIARLSLLFNARIFDVAVVDLGPNIGVSVNTDAQPTIHFGFVVRPAVSWGGPL
jgi:hypothetical protein